MNEDIFSIIEYKMPEFSKGQKRIASLIREAYDKTAFMTASTLGKQAGVSESTVVRFAVELGYEGYPQMQKAMQDVVLNRLTSVQRIGFTNARMDGQDPVSVVLRSDADNIYQTEETIDRNEFNKTVQDIVSAKNIYILGMRLASVLANFLGYYLKYMFSQVRIITNTDSGDILEQLLNLQAADVVIAFSFPRYATITTEAVAYCRSVGATVIGITNSSVSPLAAFCDRLLIAKSDMVSVVDSLIAPMSLVNALIVSLASQKDATVRDNLYKLEKIWQVHHIYENKDDRL